MNKDSLRNTDVEAKRLLADTDEPNAFECEQKMSGYLLFSVISAILASFVFGWNIGVINSPKDVISDCKIENYPSNTLPACLPMTQLEWSAVVAIFAVGGLFGGSLGGKFCKFLGRKNTIFYNNIITLSAGVLMAFSVNIWMFGLGRILVGFSSGIATGAVPMYVAEISPNRYRGAMGTLHQLAIVIAILCSQLLSLPLSTISGWRILMSLTIIPGALQMILFPFCVETPSYLASKGEISMAEKSLKRLRNSECVKDELDSILAAQVSTAEEANLSFVQLLRSSELRKALIIAVVAQLAQQLSGINGVLQFSSSIFEKIAPGQEKVFTVGIGVINLFSTVLAVLLMDRSGRRTLLLISQFGMAAISALVVVTSVVSWNLLTVALIVIFVAVFAIGLGPIPWLIMPEIFPTYAISAASSLCVMINWLSNFLVSLLFDTTLASIAPYSFLPFAVISFFLALIMYGILPETKGKSLEEVVNMLK